MTPTSNFMGPAKLPVGALGLAALLATSAVNHFVRPGFYYPVIPQSITAAAGLLLPETRRAAGICTAVMFAGFTAGHLSALKHAFGPTGTKRARIIHSLRLPLQVPLIVWAWRTRQL